MTDVTANDVLGYSQIVCSYCGEGLRVCPVCRQEGRLPDDFFGKTEKERRQVDLRVLQHAYRQVYAPYELRCVNPECARAIAHDRIDTECSTVRERCPLTVVPLSEYKQRRALGRCGWCTSNREVYRAGLCQPCWERKRLQNRLYRERQTA